MPSDEQDVVGIKIMRPTRGQAQSYEAQGGLRKL